MPKRFASWHRLKPDTRPFTEEEDTRIINAARLGCVTFGNPYTEACPERRYGDILERRNELKEAGRYTPPKSL